MGLIARPNTYATGTASSSEANANETTLYTLVNGNIEDANIKAAAAIAQSKIADLTTDLANKIDATTAQTWSGNQTFNDSILIKLGTGGDTSLQYDASNLLWDLDLVGSGGLRITRSTAGADANCAVDIEVDADDANSFVLCLRGNRATPGDADEVLMTFDADDDTNTRRTICQVSAKFDDVTSTTMDSSMKFAVMSDSAASVDTTATLTNAGVWTDASSFRELKDMEPQFDRTKVLAALKTLEVGRYRRKGKPDVAGQERHIGPFADDFHNAFKTGKDINGIAAHDMAGVALMACQEILDRVELLERRP